MSLPLKPIDREGRINRIKQDQAFAVRLAQEMGMAIDAQDWHGLDTLSDTLEDLVSGIRWDINHLDRP